IAIFLMIGIYILGFSPFFPDLGCQRCSDGWLTYGRSCFYLSTYRLNWENSQRTCTSRGGSLAVITSQEVQVDLISHTSRCWVSKYP
uniref:Uncharacterized protein n=1 Tax=Monopterus albus TaxID=43700 RepID=A0A3Q3KR13_MONAL